MTVRAKTAAVLTAAVLAVVATGWAAARLILLPEFERLERAGSSENARRALGALREEAARLNRLAADWSTWDDTYAFVEDLDPRYVESNLTPETFTLVEADFMAWVHVSGRLVMARTLDPDGCMVEGVPAGLEPWLGGASPLMVHFDPDQTASGVLVVAGGPLLVAARPILTSTGGGPTRGTFVLGRFLTPATLSYLGTVTHLPIEARRVDDPALPADFRAALTALESGLNEVALPLGRNTIAGYAVERDLAGQPALMLRVAGSRPLRAQGERSIGYLLGTIAAACLLGLGLSLLLLETMVLARLRQLGRDLARVGAAADPAARVEVRGTDEIATLARSVNETLAALGSSRRERAESDERYLALVASSQEGIVLFDAESRRLLEANPAFLRMVGSSAEELVGLTVDDLVDVPREEVDAALRRVLEEGRAALGEGSWRLRSGATVDVSVSACALSVRGRQVVAGVVHDISERQEAERRVRASEERHRIVAEQTGQMIYDWDVGSGRISWAGAIERITGFTAAEYQAVDIRAWETMIHPDDRRLALEGLERARSSCSHYRVEYRLQRRDGSYLHAEDNGAFVADEQGRAVRMLGTMKDVTERHRVEEDLRRAHDELERRVAERTAELARANEALRASEEQYRTLVENVNDVIFVVDAAGVVTYASPALERFSGFTPEEVIGKHLSAVVHGDDLAEVEGSFRRTLAGVLEPSEFRLLGEGGREIFVRSSSRPLYRDGQPAGLTGVLTDLTSHREAEQALRASEERFRALVESQAEGVVVVGRELRLELANPAARRLLGVSGDELLQRSLGEFVDPAQAEELSRGCLAVARGEVAECELRIRRADGSQRLVHLTATPQAGSTGTLVILRDVTEEREAQARIRLLASTVESITECVSITDLEGRVLFVNKAFLATYGFAEEELIGRSIQVVRSPSEPLERSREIEAATLAGGWTGELVNRRKDGTEFPILLSTALLRDEAGVVHGMIGVAADISERRRLEEQLRLSQRMEAIGLLAGGIAHDFNNLLSVLVGTTEIIRRGLPPSSPLLEEVVTARRAVEEAAKLTRGLLAYARRQRLEPQDLDLARTLGEMVPMLRRVLPEHIELRFQPSAEPLAVRADRGQLEQVLMNLCINARDAMPRGGTLSVTTAGVTLGPEFLVAHPWGEPGAYARIEVEDTGSGMDEETLERVFEPFFTTKEMGRGTGLGLATVYGIVKQHGGIIDVASAPGRGTTFVVYLPLVQGLAAVERVEVAPVQARPGTETILVVEDQEDLRRTVAKFLELEGYRVVEACNGAEALAVLGQAAQAVDLVFSDLIMPGVGGWELYSRRRDLGRGIPFLFSSGHDERLAREGLAEGEGVGFIPKPYDLVDLTRKIRDMLDAAGARHHG